MRVLIKVVIVLMAAAGATVAASRLATGRRPSLTTLAVGTAAGGLAVLGADWLIGW